MGSTAGGARGGRVGLRADDMRQHSWAHNFFHRYIPSLPAIVVCRAVFKTVAEPLAVRSCARPPGRAPARPAGKGHHPTRPPPTAQVAPRRPATQEGGAAGQLLHEQRARRAELPGCLAAAARPAPHAAGCPKHAGAGRLHGAGRGVRVAAPPPAFGRLPPLLPVGLRRQAALGGCAPPPARLPARPPAPVAGSAQRVQHRIHDCRLCGLPGAQLCGLQGGEPRAMRGAARSASVQQSPHPSFMALAPPPEMLRAAPVWLARADAAKCVLSPPSLLCLLP